MNRFQEYFKEPIVLVTRINGGVTNNIFKVTTDRDYILRFFGSSNKLYIFRDNEGKIISDMNNIGIGPKIIKKLTNGRIEEFLPGNVVSDPISNQKKICNIVKKLHSFPLKSYHIKFWDRFNYWKKIIGFIYEDKINRVIESINSRPNNYWNEIVFGHGDLSLGNIMIHQGKINLIDFEYSGATPRGFDIANHLCEYGGILDYKYPSKKVRKSLISEYLGYTCTELDLEMIDLYAKISHYYWGCWGQIQSTYSYLGFDYKAYSKKRFDLI